CAGCWLSLYLLAAPPVTAQQVTDRFIIDFNVRCHKVPGDTAGIGPTFQIASHVPVDRAEQVRGATWYSLGSAQSPCWIYGPSTLKAEPGSPVPAWIAMVDRLLTRNDVRFVQYVQ